MKVLLTGASGFLGKYILDELKFLEYSIDTIGRNTNSAIVADISKTLPVLNENYNMVIHVAGKAHLVPKTIEEEQEFYNVNLEGTKNLINAFKHNPDYFVFISTVSVYGLDSGQDITEKATLNSLEPYGKSKILAEEAVSNWGKEKNIKITILRLPLIFGKNPPGNLNAMINAIKKKYYFNVGNGNTRKSMVLAKDVAKFIPIIAKKGGIYNLTDGHNPSFKELSSIIANHYNIKPPIALNYYIVLIMANVGEVIQKISKIKMPINKRQFKKITKPLTFNDKKARALGWNPNKIIDNPKEWLINNS